MSSRTVSTRIMNTNKNNFNKNNSNSKFCKVCYDAGKEKSIYTSHFVKSSPINGEVVCPTLKMLECRYCGEKGHTVKFCKVLIEKNNLKNTKKEKKEEEKELLSDDDVVSVINNNNDITDNVVDVTTLKGWSAIVGIKKEIKEEIKEEIKPKVKEEKEPLKTNIDLSVGSDYSRERQNLSPGERYRKKEYIPTLRKRMYNMYNMYNNNMYTSSTSLESQRKMEVKEKKKQEKSVINKNMFDGLLSDSDEDDDKNEERNNELKSIDINIPLPMIKPRIRRNWADEESDSSDDEDEVEADKSIAIKIEKERLKNGWVSLETTSSVETNSNITDEKNNKEKNIVNNEYKFTSKIEPMTRPRMFQQPQARIRKNWADEVTSSEEEEEEEKYEDTLWPEIEDMSAW